MLLIFLYILFMLVRSRVKRPNLVFSQSLVLLPFGHDVVTRTLFLFRKRSKRKNFFEHPHCFLTFA